jgi:hypothetical protein
MAAPWGALLPPYELPPLSRGLLRSLAGGAVHLQPVCVVKAVSHCMNDADAGDLPTTWTTRVELLLADSGSELWVVLGPEACRMTCSQDVKEAAVVQLHECVRLHERRKSCACVPLTDACVTTRRRCALLEGGVPAVLVRELSVLRTAGGVSFPQGLHGSVPGYTRNVHDNAYGGPPLSSGVLLELAAGRRRATEVHAPAVQLLLPCEGQSVPGLPLCLSDSLHTVALRASDALLARLFSRPNVLARLHCVVRLHKFTFAFDDALGRCVLTADHANMVGMAAAPLGAPVALEMMGLPPLAPGPTPVPAALSRGADDESLKDRLRAAEACGDMALLLSTLAHNSVPGGGNALRAALACESLSYVAQDRAAGVAAAQQGVLVTLCALLRPRAHGGDLLVVRAAACAASQVMRMVHLSNAPPQSAC